MEHLDGLFTVEVFVETREEVEVVFYGGREVEVGALGEIGDFGF